MLPQNMWVYSSYTENTMQITNPDKVYNFIIKLIESVLTDAISCQNI